MKKTLLFTAFALFANYSFSQVLGDYRTALNATLIWGSGAQAVASNWEVYNGATWVGAISSPIGNSTTPPAIGTITIRPTSNSDGLMTALFNTQTLGDFSNTDLVIEDGATLVIGYNQRFGYSLTFKSMTIKAGGKFSVPFKVVSSYGSIITGQLNQDIRINDLTIKGSLVVEAGNGTINPAPAKFIGSVTYNNTFDGNTSNIAPSFPTNSTAQKASYIQNLSGSVGTTAMDTYPAPSTNVVYPGYCSYTDVNDNLLKAATFVLAGTLPLKLISFKATQELNSASLLWTTAEEENVSHFELEKNTDGKTFSAVGNVKASNTHGPNFYSFVDENITAGVTYYRLKSIDKDGAFTYSDIKSVKNKSANISFYPNPATDVIKLQFPTVKTIGEIKIFDTLGVLKVSKNLVKGSFNIDLDIRNLNVGTYIISIQIDGDKFVQKILKQ